MTGQEENAREPEVGEDETAAAPLRLRYDDANLPQAFTEAVDSPRTGGGQDRMAPAQRVGGGLRCGVGEHRQDERFGVPERVPVIARAGQPLRRDRAPFGPGTGLQEVKQRETHRLLHR